MPRLKDGWAHGDASTPGMTIRQTAMLHFMSSLSVVYYNGIDSETAAGIAEQAEILTTAFLNQINKQKPAGVKVNLDYMSETTTTAEVPGKNLFGDDSSDPAINAKMDTVGDPATEEDEEAEDPEADDSLDLDDEEESDDDEED